MVRRSKNMKDYIIKNNYERSLNERNNIQLRINVSIVLMVSIAAGIFEVCGYFDSILFNLAVLLLAIIWSLGTFSVFKSLIVYTYQKLPSSIEILKYYDELGKWFDKYENGAGFENCFNLDYIKRLADIENYNENLNKTRRSWINRSYYLYIFCVCWFVVFIIFYIGLSI